MVPQITVVSLTVVPYAVALDTQVKHLSFSHPTNRNEIIAIEIIIFFIVMVLSEL